MSKYYQPVMELLKKLTERTKITFRLDPLMNNKYNLMVKTGVVNTHHHLILTHKTLKEILISLEFTLQLFRFIKD